MHGGILRSGGADLKTKVGTRGVAAAIGLVAAWERRSLVAYVDFEGIPTICDSYTHGVKLGDVATPERCDALAEQEVRKALVVVGRSVPQLLPDGVRVALASFVYNWGGGGRCLWQLHAVAHAESKARQSEHELTEEMEARARNTQAKLTQIAIAERRAADERVRKSAEEYAARYRRDTALASATAERQAADAAIRMIAVLLSQSDDLAGVYAAEADHRRLAGLACERAHELLRK